jgi:hypothetical protein
VSGLTTRRIADLESGVALPDDRELGALARACRVSVFDLLPPGYSLSVFVPERDGLTQVARGREALDVLLREYLAMVVELRAGRAVTAPTLRHEDLVELAAALGDTTESVAARLAALLDANVVQVPVMQTLTTSPSPAV